MHWKPKALPLGWVLWPFRPRTRMQINSKNNDGALALRRQNGPYCSGMLPLSCPLPRVRDAKSCRGLRNAIGSEGEFFEISNIQ